MNAFLLTCLFLPLWCSSQVLLRRRLYYFRPTRLRRAHAIPEGTVRLVGGQRFSEGNVEIYHLGRWGSVCDDEWDGAEANVVCKSLGFPLGAVRPTHSAQYGRARKLIWMDNLYCTGNETALHHCQFDGWKIHDCTTNEAAGAVCRTTRLVSTGGGDDIEAAASEQRTLRRAAALRLSNDQAVTPPALAAANSKLRIFTNDDINVRISGGRHKLEGRVEVQVNPDSDWRSICGDGWGLLEAMVVCRQLGFGYAQNAVQTSFFGGHNISMVLSGVRCKGYEQNLADCTINRLGAVNCPGEEENIAGVICTHELPDLVPDEKEIEASAYLEDRQLLFLQCAMEENCLSSSAYALDRNQYGWQFEQRRLLRFTARIANIGTADFRPFLPKQIWDWHACHRHYHSMEVFAHFDIFSTNGKRVAEGHKASFCLEDNNCRDGVTPKYACANYGDQGITVGCTDTYLYNIDCQWIDITDLSPGTYQLKISINPELKVSELNFDNNAALCTFQYNSYSAKVWNCTLTRP